MILKRVTYAGPGMLRALGLRAGQSRVISQDKLTPALMQRYRQHLIIQDARTNIAEFVGFAVPKRHLVGSRAQVVDHTELQERPELVIQEVEPKDAQVEPKDAQDAREESLDEVRLERMTGNMVEPSETPVEEEAPVEPSEEVATVEEEAPVEEALVDEYENMTRTQLAELARARDIKPKRSKADIIQQLRG